MPAKIRFTMVGFILMKVASFNQIVRPPNTTTTIAVTTAIFGKSRVRNHDTARLIRMAGMKTIVASTTP